ncbi:MAG: rod shape-determining protein MreC [Saprospiraceae bacterium]
MQNLLAFFYRYAFVFLFLLLEFISIRLIVNRNDIQREIYLNSSSILSGKMYERIGKIKSYFGLQEVNDGLAAENAALRAKLAEMQLQTAGSVDSVLDTTTHQRFVLLPAQIVNNSIELTNNMITINKGSLDGVKKYSTVVESNGIIGFVTQVGSRYSSIMSVLNSNARVSVMVKRSGYIGNLVWDGNSPLLMNIEAIPKHGNVQIGDTIVTTGFSHFPKGHPVGLVTRAFVLPGENFYLIQTKLFNDIAKANYVYVVDDLHRTEIDSLSQHTKE